MTLLAEIQEVIERTYEFPGSLRVNLEDFLIGPIRSGQLYSRSNVPPADRSPRACTFLRSERDALYVAIYYSPELIGLLENENPRESLSHRNITGLISFIEEVTHALHAIWAFRAGFRRIDSESFACNLEVQAKVDTYWLLLRFVRLITGNHPNPECKQWLLDRLIDDDRFDYHSPVLAKRYQKASTLAGHFIRAVDPLAPSQRVGHIRLFHSLSLTGKCRLTRRLTLR